MGTPTAAEAEVSDPVATAITKAVSDAIDAAIPRIVAEVVAALRPARRPPQGGTPEQLALVQRVYDRWRDLMGFGQRFKADPSPARLAILLARVKKGHTYEEFDAVLRWASRNPFMRGQNPQRRAYDDIENLFGSELKIERYVKQAGRPGRDGPELFGSGPTTGDVL
jgi:hypothetical protein